MPKILTVILSIAAGALGGALIVFLVAFSIYDPGPESWDYATPILIFGGSAVAALFGGAMGALAGINVSEGRTRRGLLTFAGSMAAVAVLTLVGAGGLWAFVRMLQTEPSERDKQKWAASRGPLDPQFGLELPINCSTATRAVGDSPRTASQSVGASLNNRSASATPKRASINSTTAGAGRA